MITALDGPAAGVALPCRRAPMYLRLVLRGSLIRADPDGAWDALDQVGDAPADDEDVYVYQREPGTWSAVYVCTRGRGGGGRQETGTYRWMPDAPVEELRDTEAWQQWAQSQPAIE